MNFYPLKGSRLQQLVNIPTNINYGYGKWGEGKIQYPDGKFLMYGSVNIEGGDNKSLNRRTEVMLMPSVYFHNMPCDADGNIVLISHWFDQQYNESWPSKDRLVLFLLCSQEPTHFINLQTGEMTSVAEARDYLREMLFSYSIGDRTLAS